ncbi:MAG: hypothetical protein H0X66_00180 [Verrucomicrobia bacterium]|nr:hypothetical protein [Verrucomicrobiota bacterium]
MLIHAQKVMRPLQLLIVLLLLLLVGVKTVNAGSFCAEPCDKIILNTPYPEYDPTWSKANCNDYSFSGLGEYYGPDVGRNYGWIDNDKFDTSVEGADCSAYVGRCLALPGFMPENHRKGHQEITAYMYNNGLRDKNEVKRTHRVLATGTVSEEMDGVQQWDFFVWNWTRNPCGKSSDFGGHTGIIRTFSGSNWNTREAMNPTAGIASTTRSRQLFIDRCTRFWRRDDWGDTITPPAIGTQPRSRANNIGDNAHFSVSATGTDISYQWRKNGVNITGATTAQLDFLIASVSDAGTYSIVVSNLSQSVTSANATLTIPYASWSKLTQWNFNSATPDGNVSTGTTSASHGSGVFSTVGGLTSVYNVGSPADPASWGTDNASRRFSGGFPSSTGANKSAGWLINVSTVAYTNIVVTWEQRQQAGGSKYNRLQYTTNGTTWIDHTVHTMTEDTVHVYQSSNLSGVAGVHDNANFGVRVLTEWESTAIGAGTAGFVGTTASYSTSANMLYDIVTVMGTLIPPPPPPANRPPMMGPVSSRSIHAGDTITLTCVAYDFDADDTLTYSLDSGAPPAASIDPATGFFVWATGDGDANTTNAITVRVTDDGEPPLSGTATFSVVVHGKPKLENVSVSANAITLNWNAISNKTYRVEFKNSLSDATWQALGPDMLANDSAVSVSDDTIGSMPQRYYRLVAVED